VDEAGRFYEDYGWLHGTSTGDAADQIVGDLRERGLLVEVGLYEHRYPHCWRCDTPLIWRVADDWFIRVEEIRQPLLDANGTVEWTPPQYGKRMDDWFRNMSDWNISRRRYYGLPLPFYPCSCGRLNVMGSKAELEERAVEGFDQLQELHRPWIDRVLIRCDSCGEPVRRISEVGDVWLDAGIVPFSTLGWQNPEWIDHGYATGAARSVTSADLPDHSYWEQWFPADWVSEMREQIRLWFYSQLFMSVALTGKAPYRQVLTYEKLLDFEGREMHGSWGNLIEAEEAFDRMGADVMRWLYCQQPPTQNIRFGFAPAEEVKRRLLTLWNSARFLVDYANVSDFKPRLEDLEGGPDGDLQPLDRWIVARTAQLVADATRAYESFLTVEVVRAFSDFVDDLSNWYIRRSRPRFWAGDQVALRTLWHALVQSIRVVAPVMPFLTDHLWRNLASDVAPSIHLAGWPEARKRDERLLGAVAEARRVARLGHTARQSAGLKVRQPLRRLVVEGADLSDEHAAEVRDELRVKEVELGPVDATELRVKPNLPVLGPKLGKELAEVRAALEAGQFEELDGGRFRVREHELGPDEVLVERTGKEGWAVASGDGVTVALDTTLDPELELEGLVLDLIHQINSLRKEQGFELTDRIRITLPEAQKDLLRHEDWIKEETLAVEIETNGGSGEPQIAKA
jgi:isoleucyl-tRNA synthetase